MKKLLFLLLLLPSVLFAQENRSFTETKRGATTERNQFKIKEHNKNLLIGTSPNEKNTNYKRKNYGQDGVYP